MIVGNFANSNPYTLTGYLDRLIAKKVELPTPPAEPTLALTIPEVCCECLGVFGGGANEHQNDKSTFLYRRSDSSQSITLKLVKDSEDIATINSSTYGTYYDFGTWTTEPQNNYKVLILDWDSVYSLHGVGVYEIKAEYVIPAGSNFSALSQQFKLQEYSDYRANGTVKFQWTQNGRIRNSEFDYTGMNISQYIRVNGKFGTWDPSLETDEVIYSNYERKQIQDEIISSYTFESRLIDSYLSKLLINDMMLADDIRVTDFNLYNHRKDYINMRLRQEEISVEELASSDKAVLNLTFTDKLKNHIKQN